VTLLILTARPSLTTNRRLVEAARAAGVGCTVVDLTRAVAIAHARRSALVVDGANVLEPRPAAAIARIGNWRPETALASLEAVCAAGVFTPNRPVAMRRARDHWETVSHLARAGVRVPRSIAAMDPDLGARAAVEHLGLPVVVKVRRARMGVGVILCRELDHLQSVLDSLWRVGDEFLVQRFVAPGGTSVRALVVGDQVVASARFTACGREWRSNSAQGGAATRADLDESGRRLAVEAALHLELGVCGVDLIAGADGPVVIDVNPTPGFIALERATGIDVAAAIVTDVLRRAAGEA
jgi:ribosomal protein S6--L-glutamate ligase